MVLPRIEKTLELQLFLDSSLSKYKKKMGKLHCFFFFQTPFILIDSVITTSVLFVVPLLLFIHFLPLLQLVHSLVVHDIPQHVVKGSGDVRVGRIKNVDSSVLAQRTDLFCFAVKRTSPAIIVLFEERIAEHIAPLDF